MRCGSNTHCTSVFLYSPLAGKHRSLFTLVRLEQIVQLGREAQDISEVVRGHQISNQAAYVSQCFRKICSPSRERCHLLKMFSGLVNDIKLRASDHMRGIRTTGYRKSMPPYLGTDDGSPVSLYNLDAWGLSPAAGTFAPIRFWMLADPKGIGSAGTWCDLILEPTA